MKYSLAILVFAISFGKSFPGFCQELNEDLIQNVIENLEGSSELDFNTIFEILSYYLESPLDINNATESDLKELMLLNDRQINDIIIHRHKYGSLLSIHELQSIPSLDGGTISDLLPFIKTNNDIDNYQNSIFKMIKESKQEVFIKWRRVLQDQKGYQTEDNIEPKYEGDPNKLYTRFRLYHENKLKIGLIAEKDAGEAFFAKSNPNGFDFYSGHIHLRQYTKFLEDLVIGDFSMSYGQGLILHNDFGSNKSAYVLDLKKGGRTIKSYNSVNEAIFFRGIATKLNFSQNVSASFFGSVKSQDASIFLDTLEFEIGLESFTSLRIDGNHRTSSEISNENTLQQSAGGMNINFNDQQKTLGINVLYQKFNIPLNRQFQVYQLYNFRGNQLLNLSFDYGYRWQNFNFFGESAISDNKGMAHIAGLLMGLDKKIDLALLYRHYDKDYQVLSANSFGESTNTRNEEGIYMGLIIRPFKNWTLSSYFDQWSHDWLSFRRDAPTKGREYLCKLEYYKKRKFSAYVQYKYEEKIENASTNNTNIDKLSDVFLHRLRIHFSQKITKALEIRSRAEFSIHKQDGISSDGSLIFFDILYKPVASKFSFTTRFSVFDTDNFDSRIYAYENDLIYEFYIPFYQSRGQRFYFNTRFDLNYNSTIELRYAKTVMDNASTIGSGNDLILGNIREEVKAQVIYKF